MVRRLLQSGVLQGVPMLVSSPPMATGSGEGRFTAENLRQVLRPGRWNLRFGLYGHEAMVRARRDLLEREVAAIPGAVMELRQYAGDAGPEDVEPRDLIAAGIPNQVLLDRLKGVFGDSFGHMDFRRFCPLMPIMPAARNPAG
jgi:4-cresol dehydrogenase (hydroxylating)